MSCVGTNFNLILIILTNFIEKHTRSPSKNVLTKVAEKASLGVISITSIGQELMKAKIFQKSKLVFTVREKYRASVFRSTVLWKYFGKKKQHQTKNNNKNHSFHYELSQRWNELSSVIQSGRQIYFWRSFPGHASLNTGENFFRFIFFHLLTWVPSQYQFISPSSPTLYSEWNSRYEWYNMDHNMCLLLVVLSITITAEKPLLNYMKTTLIKSIQNQLNCHCNN